MKKLKLYIVEYKMWNGEFPTPISLSQIVSATDIKDAIAHVEAECYLNYMCCEIKSVSEKENEDE